MIDLAFNLEMALAFIIGLASLGNPADQTAYSIHEITVGAKPAKTLVAVRTPAGFQITTESTSREESAEHEKGAVVASKKVESKITETITVAPTSESLKFDLIGVDGGTEADGKTTVALAALFKNIKDTPLSDAGMHVLRLAGPDGKDVEICVARFENMVVVQQNGSMTAFCIHPSANKPSEATP
jgi:hypothetical protein